MKRVVVEGGAYGLQHAFCDHPDCSNYFKIHHWGAIQAHNEGWFLQKSGDCWCPEHIPEWAALWRAKKRGDYLGS